MFSQFSPRGSMVTIDVHPWAAPVTTFVLLHDLLP